MSLNKLHLKFTFSFLLIFFGFTKLIGQPSNLENITLKSLKLSDGFTDIRFNPFVYQDSRGFIWISSISGAYRYDGCSFKIHEIEDKVVGNNVQSDFTEDKYGNIWYSVYESLACYDRCRDTILTFQVSNKDKKQLVGYNLIEVGSENIWFQVDSYLWTLSLKTPTISKKITKLDAEKVYLQKKSEQNHIDIISHSLLGNNDFFLRKISCDRNQENTCYEKKFDFKEKILHGELLSDSTWIFLHKRGLVKFSINNDKITEVINFSDSILPYSFSIINKDSFLVSTKKNGLLLCKVNVDDIIDNNICKAITIQGLLSSNTREINLTQNNMLWVSFWDKGLNYGNIEADDFFKFPNINSEITSILVTSDKIDICTGDDGNYYLSNNILKEEKLPSINFIWSSTLFHDVKFIAYGRKVYFKNSVNNYLKIENQSDATSFRLFSKIANRLLISTDKGIKEIKKSPTNEYYIGDCPEFKEYPTFSFIQLFQSQHSLKTYVPYNATDLWVYQATPDSLRLITKLKTGLEFFGFTDSQKEAGTIWAGSAKGLIKITQDTVITRLMDKDEKLKNVAVYSVVEDKKGVLWLGTNQGLFQYFPDTRQTYQYEEIDGLPSRTFSLLNSAIITDEGEIWMGTNKGVVRFNPDEVKPYSTPPNVYIDGLLINDTEPVKGIGERDSLHLTYEENTLLFDVKAIGYYKAKRNKINYRMQGYENDWVNIKNGQMIRYAKLPPGNYMLQVQAEDVNGNQSQIRDLEIFVRPPFWQTWWFYLTLTLTAISAAFALYRYRVGLVRKEEEQKTAVANLNLQVVETEMKALKAQMNPHFLFNSMNSIKGLILKQNTRKASEYLTKFSVLLRSILANSEKRHILLATELETLRLYIELEALRFTREIDYQIETTPDIDIDFISIPPLVLQPFVENAIWHGLLPKQEEKNSLRLHIEREQDFIIYTIQDNGVGRAATTNHKKLSMHKSMGIGITRKRIELIHPENSIQIIDLHDKQGKAAGTQVVLRIYEPE